MGSGELRANTGEYISTAILFRFALSWEFNFKFYLTETVIEIHELPVLRVTKIRASHARYRGNSMALALYVHDDGRLFDQLRADAYLVVE